MSLPLPEPGHRVRLRFHQSLALTFVQLAQRLSALPRGSRCAWRVDDLGVATDICWSWARWTSSPNNFRRHENEFELGWYSTCLLPGEWSLRLDRPARNGAPIYRAELLYARALYEEASKQSLDHISNLDLRYTRHQSEQPWINRTVAFHQNLPMQWCCFARDWNRSLEWLLRGACRYNAPIAILDNDSLAHEIYQRHRHVLDRRRPHAHRPAAQRAKRKRSKAKKKAASFFDAVGELDSDCKRRILVSASPRSATVPSSDSQHDATAAASASASSLPDQGDNDDNDNNDDSLGSEQQQQHHAEQLAHTQQQRDTVVREKLEHEALEIASGECPNVVLLATELLLLIFERLDVRDLASLRRVCRLFSALVPLVATWRDFIHTRDLHGTTPLHLACFTGSLDGVAFLLENGADPYAADVTGLTPHDIARRLGLDAISWLIAQISLNTILHDSKYSRRKLYK